MFKDRICSWCKSTFTPKSSTTKYCCEECKRSEFLYNQIPEDFHSSTLSDLEFIKTYLVSDKGTKKAFTSRLDHAVIHKSPQFERIKRIQAFAESSIVGDDISNVDKIRLLANGVTFRPVCETEGCNRLTKYVGLGFNRICHSFCSTNTLHIPYPSEHCHWCGSTTENGSPFCSTNIARCSQIYFEHILPFENGIKAATEEGLADYELVKKFGFNDNGVFRKWLADENAVKILGTTAFKEVVEKASEFYGETSSNAIRALVYGLGERPVCAAEGCEERVRLPHGLGKWNKYCSTTCSGKGEIAKNTGTRVTPKPILQKVKDENWMRSKYEELGNNLLALSRHIGVSEEYTRNHLLEHGIEVKRSERSILEIEFKSMLDKAGVDYIENHRPDWLIPKGKKRKCEIDFFIPSLNTGFELNGERWHSEQYKDRLEHFHKFEKCKEHGVRLVQIFGVNLFNRKQYWEKYVGFLGKEFPLNARELSIGEVSPTDAESFLNENHPMGFIHSQKHIGLFEDGYLLACASYVKKGEGCELLRFATRLGFRIRGALSKICSNVLKRNGFEFVETFVSHNFGDGDSYLKSGFELVKIEVDKTWANPQTMKILSRYETGETPVRKMLGASYNNDLNVSDNLRANGYFKVYDAGVSKYVMKKGA